MTGRPVPGILLGPRRDQGAAVLKGYERGDWGIHSGVCVCFGMLEGPGIGKRRGSGEGLGAEAILVMLSCLEAVLQDIWGSLCENLALPSRSFPTALLNAQSANRVTGSL